ncbi:MAG: hypothetical protein DMF06_00195 [Verrucomicrobia bacterium]|nr:MAG: hypothetical protein DMF06_00195 [Verrucomicrobiota bacterium]
MLVGNGVVRAINESDSRQAVISFVFHSGEREGPNLSALPLHTLISDAEIFLRVSREAGIQLDLHCV